MYVWSISDDDDRRLYGIHAIFSHRFVLFVLWHFPANASPSKTSKWLSLLHCKPIRCDRADWWIDWNNNKNRRHYIYRCQTNYPHWSIHLLLPLLIWFCAVVAVLFFFKGAYVDQHGTPQLYDGTISIFFFFFVVDSNASFVVCRLSAFIIWGSRHQTRIDFFHLSLRVRVFITPQKNVISTKKWKHKHWRNICR